MEKTNRQIEKATNLLLAKRQIILCGPPGTGKTYLAEKIVKEIISEQETLTTDDFIPKTDDDLFNEMLRAVSLSHKVTLKLEKYQTYSADNTRYFLKYANQKDVFTLHEKQLSEASDNDFFVFGDYYYFAGIYAIPKKVLISNIQENELEPYPNPLRYNLWLVNGGRDLRFTNAEIPINLEDFRLKKTSKQESLSFFKEIVQFHPSYTYEDFVRGLVAEGRTIEEGGGVNFKPQDKVFAQMCSRAKEFSDKKFVLIIDEINRADMAKVFGELIYGLEYRGKPISTPYHVGDTPDAGKLVIPRNLYIIGTMNTADKSIALLDYAIRRRFVFVHLYPSEEKLIKYYEEEKKEGPKDEALALFAKVSQLIPDNHDLKVGHTYFMAERKEELKIKFIYEVCPLIIEYIKAGEEGVKKEDNPIWQAYTAGPEKMNEALNGLFTKWTISDEE